MLIIDLDKVTEGMSAEDQRLIWEKVEAVAWREGFVEFATGEHQGSEECAWSMISTLLPDDVISADES